MAEDFNPTPSTSIGEKRVCEPKALLEQALAEKPAEWRPMQTDGQDDSCYFWDMQEFQAYCLPTRLEGKRRVVWVDGWYSRACYLWPFDIEERDPQAAFQALQRGHQIEPDHPHLCCETRHLLQLLPRREDALECYLRAQSVRARASPQQRGRALRGQGINLIDRKRTTNHIIDGVRR